MEIGIHIVGKMEEASGRFSERVDVKTVICDLDLFWLSEVMLTLRLEMQPLSKHKHNWKKNFEICFLGFSILFSSGVKA